MPITPTITPGPWESEDDAVYQAKFGPTICVIMQDNLEWQANAKAISLLPRLIDFIKNVATNPRPWDQEAQALLKELE